MSGAASAAASTVSVIGSTPSAQSQSAAIAMERMRDDMTQLSVDELVTIRSEMKLLTHLRESEARLIRYGFTGEKYPKMQMHSFSEGDSNNWEHITCGEAMVSMIPMKQQQNGESNSSSSSSNSAAPTGDCAAVCFTLGYTHECPRSKERFDCAHSWELSGDDVSFSWSLRTIRYENPRGSEMQVDGLRDLLRELGVLPPVKANETADDIQNDSAIALKFLQDLYYVFEPTDRPCHGSSHAVGADEPSYFALLDQWGAEKQDEDVEKNINGEVVEDHSDFTNSGQFSGLDRIFKPQMQSASKWMKGPQKQT